MAKQSGRAGQSTYEMARKRRSSMLTIGLIGIGALIVLGILVQNASALGIGGIGILVLFVLMSKIPDIADTLMARKQKESKRAYRGAVAEEAVGDLLSGLDSDQYQFYHDISTPYGNIDHVVISRQTGVYLLETKSHHGKVEITESGLLVNGNPPEKDFIAQTLRNTYWLRDCLMRATGQKVWIRPVIVFTNAFVVPGKPIKNVAVINGKYLTRYIQQQRGHPANEALWAVRAQIAQTLFSQR
jgi:hypothetical protein